MNDSNTILFLTACISPNGMAFTALQNPKVRLQHYILAIEYYIENTTLKILVVENTGYDLTLNFKSYVEDGRVEILTFQGNNYNKRLGKGFGEALIIKYAFKHSNFIKNNKYIIKVSGRHIVSNLNQIIWGLKLLHSEDDFISATLIRKEKYAISDAFVASKSFFEKLFISQSQYINDEAKYYFEHALHDVILKGENEGFQFVEIPFLLMQQGQSGSTGKTYHISWKMHIKSYIKFILVILGLWNYFYKK